MPEGLNIDYKRKLHGTVAPYVDHLLFHTGGSDWPSKIEDDVRYPLVGSIKASLKDAIVKSFPKRPTNLLVTTSSLGPMSMHQEHLPHRQVTASLLKSGLHVYIDGQPDHQQSFLHDLVDCVTADSGWSKEVLQKRFMTKEIQEIVVLICGHGNRDMRCGVMGPLLQKEFENKFEQKEIKVINSTVSTKSNGSKTATVGLISHIGGHAFAGNCIVYIPATAQYGNHPLAGKGVWYGRVEPKHVEGIIESTIEKGIIIEELLRGVV